MALRITIDIFSGRPNPVIELSEGESKRILERLRPARPLKRTEPRLPPFSTLGYRGLVIEQTGAPTRGLPKVFRFAHGDVFGPELAHRAADPDFEEFFGGSAGPIRKAKLGREFPAFLRREINRSRKLRLEHPWKPIPWPHRERCRCAPLYEPA